jgi:hypothetical protein
VASGQTVGPAHCPSLSAGPARARGPCSGPPHAVPGKAGRGAAPSAKRTLAGSATFGGDGRGRRSEPAPQLGCDARRGWLWLCRAWAAVVDSGGTECHTAPGLIPPGLLLCQPRGRVASQLSASSPPLKPSAYIPAFFGPGHACKGSRSELLQQKRARGHCFSLRVKWVTGPTVPADCDRGTVRIREKHTDLKSLESATLISFQLYHGQVTGLKRNPQAENR